MPRLAAIRRFVLAAALVAIAAPPAQAVEPGIDIPAPRVAITTVTGISVAFNPRNIVVEQNDHVRWRWTGGSHDTTSGTGCTPSGLWTSDLNSAVQVFTRQFTEPPSTIPFFCQPHCGIGMNGTVVITTPISVTAVPAAGGAAQLNWTGGGGLYRIFRSTSPLFPGPTTTVLTGGTGTNATTFTEPLAGAPAVGAAHFYLVMNHF